MKFINTKIVLGISFLFLTVLFSGCVLNPSTDSTGEALRGIEKISTKPVVTNPVDVNDDENECITLTNAMRIDYTYNGQTITVCSGTYTLPNGIWISDASNFTLDCVGQAVLNGDGAYDENIWYSGHYGIQLSGQNNTVKNCTVKNYLKGFEVSGFNGTLTGNTATGKSEKTTTIYLGNGTLIYTDENHVQSHTVPFYTLSLSMSDESSNTKVIDGQTIWYKINTTDSNSADGNITFRENSSTGALIAEIQYTDEDYSKKIIFKGQNAVPTYTYRLMVDEIGSTARVWLMLDLETFIRISWQYNKNVWLFGTDTDENGSINYPFYLPHSQYLPSQLGGDTSYNANDYYVAHFKINEGKVWHHINAFIDTGTGNLIAFPIIALDYYSYEVDYLAMNLHSGEPFLAYLSESYAVTYPSSDYSRYGSFIELDNHKFKAVIPENAHNSYGFVAIGKSDTVLSNNESENNLVGLMLDASSDLTLSKNEFCSNVQADILCSSANSTSFNRDKCDTVKAGGHPVGPGCDFSSCPIPCPLPVFD